MTDVKLSVADAIEELVDELPRAGGPVTFRSLTRGLVEKLTPYGGIRIEDDVLVTEDGGEDLTRPLIPGHGDE